MFPDFFSQEKLFIFVMGNERFTVVINTFVNGQQIIRQLLFVIIYSIQIVMDAVQFVCKFHNVRQFFRRPGVKSLNFL